MTAHDTPRQGLFPAGFAAAAGDGFRKAGEWVRRLLIAMAVILAAGILAVVTAMFGLVLAAIAILMRFAGRGVDFDVRGRNRPSETLTLEARRTPRGWTVE
ncbi:MAG: hypothetical protein AAF253_14065 [Pseudomonadota bacterium]